MYADLVFAGGPVFAGPGQVTTDVAVRDGRIMSVGPASSLIGPATEVVPIGDGMLIPGIQDAHVHPVWGGLEQLRCDLSDMEDLAGYRRKIAAYVRDHPRREWVTGGGWAMPSFPGGTPHKRDLDDVVPDRPVLLHNCDHHGAWVNSRALRLAGIDRHTPDPADGRIERDPDGSPTGLLHEGAMALVTRLLPATTDAELIEGLRAGQAHLHRYGITGWQDAILGEYGGYRDPAPAYRTLAASGELTGRVCGALWWDRDRGVEQIPSLVERRELNAVGDFATPMVKMMLDGVAENFTAAVSSPYLGGRGSGLSFVDFAALPTYAAALVEAGFGIHFHAIGDAAVKAALAAVAHAGPASSGLRATGAVSGRHQVAHLQLVDPVDVRRFGELGVIANMQPFWACHEPQLDTLAVPFLGPERATWLYPFGDLRRGGAPLAAGSDWPVSSADPWQGMHVAVHRSYEGLPLLPAQRLSLTEALTAYTSGSCHANGCDDTGVIEPGRLADLVLIDRNPFTGPIRDTRVLRTYVGGRLVFEAR